MPSIRLERAATLPPGHERSQIVYRAFMEMTYTELQDATGMTEGELKSDVRRLYNEGWPRKGRGKAPSTDKPGGEPNRGQGTPSLSHEQPAGATFDGLEDINPADQPEPSWHARQFVTADARRARLRSYLGTTYRPSPIYHHAPRDVRVVVGVGDFHGKPDPAIVRGLVEANADVYVLGGDTLDNQQASRHPSETVEEARARRRDTTRDEVAEMRAVLELLLEETGGRVYVMRGNHDAWPTKRVLSELPEWILDFYTDPLEVMVDGLGDRCELAAHHVVHYFPDGTHHDTKHNNEFMFVLDDVLFSHLNFTASVTEPGVSKLYRFWFQQWERPLRLQHVRMLVHFHVHYRNFMNVSGGHMLLVEPGMGGTVDSELYKHSYQGKWKPSVRGFVRFEQFLTLDGWRLDPSSVELVAPHMGSAQASKREVA